MNDVTKTKVFITMYMSALKAICKNSYLKSPVVGGKKYEQLDKARQIVDGLGGDYSDYIHVQFQAFRNMKGIFAPKPEHLISKGAIERYKVFQMKKNKYVREDYTIDGDKFIVAATGKSYPFWKVEVDSSEDIASINALLISKSLSYKSMIDKGALEKALEDIEYLLAKLKYKGKMPMDSLIRARDEIKEMTND